MAPLKKATLREIGADKAATPVPKTEIEVQFNPASLKLELANKVEGGKTTGRQVRQYLGKTSTTLSFDLHFDTADRGTTEKPVSVRTLTAAVERFVLPKGKGNTKQKPPKARFQWDELVIDGIIESLSIDFDLFAANGTPLRAKMAVTIKEQDAKYELLETGPGANAAGNATPPGAPGNGPGTTGGSQRPDATAPALAGESAADFAARMGLDPAAWRGIAAGIGGSALSLSAGAAIDFSTSLSAGVGLTAGVEAGLGGSLGASFGLDVTASAGFGGTAATAGFALSAAGGVGAAIETVAIVETGRAAGTARQSFGSAAAAPAGVPAPSAQPKPSMPSQSRTPLRRADQSRVGDALPPAPAPPLADARSTSFGFGVPLRPSVGHASDLRASAAAGRIPLRPRARLDEVNLTADPTIAPWTQLPADRARRAVDRLTSHRHPARPCGCGGKCHHGGR